MADNVMLRAQSLGNLFLFALDGANEFRVVVQQHDLSDPTTPPQIWTRTSRGDGRYTFHRGTDGNERYLTAEDTTNRSRVVTAAKNDDFNRQTWRDNPHGYLELGTSERWLQPDDTIDCGQRFVVEIVTQGSLTQASQWTQIDA